MAHTSIIYKYCRLVYPPSRFNEDITYNLGMLRQPLIEFLMLVTIVDRSFPKSRE